MKCEAVLCCRMTPGQKANVILYKFYKTSSLLIHFLDCKNGEKK